MTTQKTINFEQEDYNGNIQQYTKSFASEAEFDSWKWNMQQSAHNLGKYFHVL